MRPPIPHFVFRALGLLLALGLLAGCSTLHGWAQAGTNRTSSAGASVSIPLGK